MPNSGNQSLATPAAQAPSRATVPPRMDPRCPTCKRPVSEGKAGPAFPFCSPRCKLADLGSWLSNRYVVTGGAPDPEGSLDETELLALMREHEQESS